MFKKASSLIFLGLVLCCYSYAGAGNKDGKSKSKQKISDKTPVDKFKNYLGDLDSAGLMVGAKAPDITVYTEDGMPVRISELLKDKVPILLVGGSYSCPRFREHSPDVDEIKHFYKEKLNVYIVYITETHPTDAACPFSGDIEILKRNIVEEALTKQTKTFGERKAMADTTKAREKLEATMFIDGPDNEYWEKYGPAANNAYLIDTDMVVRARHTWLNEEGANMWCDIDRLLKTSSGNCK